MATRNNIFGSFGSMDRMNMKAAFDFSHISKDVQNHLIRVYGVLATMLAMCAAGVATSIALGINLGILPVFISIPLLIWIGWQDQTQMGRKFIGLIAFGFLDGLVIGPLVEVALHMDPSIPLTAFVATAIIFVCFSLAAVLTAGDRTYLFLGGFLSSALSIMFWMSIAGMFSTSVRTMTFPIQLYGGLLVFIGYVMYDTQVMIVKANAGERDFCWHAIELFIDFVAIFVRILIILMRNRDNRKNKRSGGNTTRSR